MSDTDRESALSKPANWLIAGFACAILLQLELVFDRPGNWDEFFHLSEAHAFHQGRLTEALQVFYARAFFWLPLLPVDAIDQIRVARLFMLGCELFTAWTIFAMASRFTERIPAAVAALAYLTGGYVFQHGFSYRADPMAAAFLMGALWILLVSRLRAGAILVAALLAGLAALTTIKVVLYAPAFAGIAWLRWNEAADRRDMLLRLAAFAGAATLFAALFIGLTILSLPGASPGSAETTVTASRTMILREGLFPQWPYILGALGTAPIMALLVVLTPFQLVRNKLPRPEWIALAGLMLPLASVIVYRNSFPYFYAYILAPVMVSTAIATKTVLTRISLPAFIAALLVNAALSSFATPREVLPVQRQVIAVAHTIFPQPVAYFDYAGLLVDFPKANFFMTGWGFQKYRAGIEKPFTAALAQQTVPLLVLDKPVLERNQLGAEPAKDLLPEDAAALREGFIHHWGPLWVAGRRFPAASRLQDFKIFTPGTYTLEGAPARIDGQAYAPGQTMTLERGMHRFEKAGEGEAALRWGNHLKVPVEPFAGGPIFEDF